MHKKILTILFFVLFAAPETAWLWGPVPCFAQYADTAWVRRYNGPGNSSDGAGAIAVDDSGNVYVTGRSVGSGMSVDYATIKYYPNGDTAWVRRYDGPANSIDIPLAIAIDTSGNVYVTGASIGSGTFEDCATIKYYPNGDTAWVRRYNGPANDYDEAHAIAVDDCGNVYVTGYSGNAEGSDYATIKYYPNGDTAWVRTYNGPGDGGDYAQAIAVDSLGNVYVTGDAWYSSPGGLCDYATIKYYPNGDTAWLRTYNGSANSSDAATGIAVDDSGNVYVTGGSVSAGAGDDYATIKYKPNGDTAWTRKYNGPVNGQDCAYAIAVDDFGNVYVTGESYGSGENFDYATVKYYPNGDNAWVRRYNGPGNAEDQANAIAVDGYGNIYVTGQSIGSGTEDDYDYATIRYYPNGDTTWVRRYSGPGNGPDYAYAIAVDGSGNVYVTGFSYDSETYGDYVTIKYLQYMTDGLIIVAFGPVDLIVTDPKGDSIGIGFNTIPGATYDTAQDRDSVTIPNRLVGLYIIRVFAEPTERGVYSLGIRIDGSDMVMLATDHPSPSPDEADTFYYNAPLYLRGDASGDWKITASDVVYLINYLYIAGPAPEPLEAGDVNCDGTINAADIVYLINYLYIGGPPPSC
jgi:hypothetical protein